MVTLTDNAIGVIRQLTDQPGVAAGAGLRFATGSSPGTLAVNVVEQPDEGDEVLHISGVRLFLDGLAARLLDGRVLDASAVNGSVSFAVSEGTPDTP